MSNISLISLPFFKISLIQSILRKSSFNLLLSNLSVSFIQISFREWFWSYEIFKNNKLGQMVRDWMRLSIRFFDLSVTLVGWRTSGVENNEHIVLWNWELSDLLLIFIKLMLKSRIKKQNLSTIFSFSKSGVKYFELKSAMAILGRL